MKKITLISILVILLFNTSNAQWQNTGPEGGIVFDIVSNSTSLVCGTNRGVYRSTDAGDNWTEVNNGLNAGIVSNLVVHNDSIVITNNAGNYNSPTGANWTKIATPWGVRFSLDPYIFAISGSTIYRSSNGGRTWPVANNLGSTIGSYTSDGTTIYVSEGPWVLKSTNFGQTFSFMDALPCGTPQALLSSSIGVLAIAADCGGIGRVYKDNPGGSTWNILSTNQNLNNPVSFFEDNSILYIATKNAIYSSPDGVIWTQNLGNLPYCEILKLKNINNKFIACTSLGIYISTDKGVTWIEKNKNIKAHNIRASVSTPTGLYVGLNSSEYGYLYSGSSIEPAQYGGIYKLNTSNAWQKTTFPDTVSVNQIIAQGTNLYVIGVTPTAVRMYRSIDDGATWQALGNETLNAVSMVYTNNTLFASIDFSTKEVITSVDNGTTWTHLVDNLPYNYSLTNLTTKGSDLYAIVPLYPNYGGGVYKSADYGLTWNAVNGSLGNMVVDKLGAIGSVLYANQSNVFGGIYAHVSNSTNNGLNWNLTGITDIPNQTITSITDHNGVGIFSTGLKAGGSIVADTGNIIITADNGSSWINITGSLSQRMVQSTSVFNGNLYVGTYGSSVWSLPLTQILSVQNIKNTTSFVVLYPNPAKENIFIQSTEKIKNIKCSNYLGQTVDANFENNYIDISNLSEGIYFLNLTTLEGAIITQKFIKE